MDDELNTEFLKLYDATFQRIVEAAASNGFEFPLTNRHRAAIEFVRRTRPDLSRKLESLRRTRMAVKYDGIVPTRKDVAQMEAFSERLDDAFGRR